MMVHRSTESASAPIGQEAAEIGSPLDKALSKAFSIIEECAVRGERCPVTSGPEQHPYLRSGHLGKLARAGLIFIEISNRNWRRVTILSGPHKGKSTPPNPDPHGRKVWQTVGREGARVNGKLTDHGASSRRQPSTLPRWEGSKTIA